MAAKTATKATKRGRPRKTPVVSDPEVDDSELDPEAGDDDDEDEVEAIDEAAAQQQRTTRRAVSMRKRGKKTRIPESGAPRFAILKETYGGRPDCTIAIEQTSPVKASKPSIPMGMIPDYNSLIQYIRTHHWRGQQSTYRYGVYSDGWTMRGFGDVVLDEDPDTIRNWERKAQGFPTQQQFPQQQFMQAQPQPQQFPQQQFQQTFQQPFQQSPFGGQPQPQQFPQQQFMQQPTNGYGFQQQFPQQQFMPTMPQFPSMSSFDDDDDDDDDEEDRRSKAEIRRLNRRIEQMQAGQQQWMMQMYQQMMQHQQPQPQPNNMQEAWMQFFQAQQQSQQASLENVRSFAQNFGQLQSQLAALQSYIQFQQNQQQLPPGMQGNPQAVAQQQQAQSQLSGMLDAVKSMQTIASALGWQRPDQMATGQEPGGLRMIESPGGRIVTDAAGKPLDNLMQLWMNFDKVQSFVESNVDRVQKIREAQQKGQLESEAIVKLQGEIKATQAAVMDIRNAVAPVVEQMMTQMGGMQDMGGGTKQIQMPSKEVKSTRIDVPLSTPTSPQTPQNAVDASGSNPVALDHTHNQGSLLAGLEHVRGS